MYFDIETFFDLSSLETMYRTDTTDDATGKSVLNRFALTNNDQNFFDKLLKRGASEAYRVLQPFCQTLTDAYGFNTIPGATIEELDAIDTDDLVIDLLYEMEDTGTITLGTLAVVVGDKVKYDGTEWVKDNDNTTKYIFYYMNIPYNFDMNNLNPLNEKVEEFISIYVVKEWFRRQKYDYQFITEEYQIVERELLRIINFRAFTHRRPTQIF
jgi:hypothetical protein